MLYTFENTTKKQLKTFGNSIDLNWHLLLETENNDNIIIGKSDGTLIFEGTVLEYSENFIIG